MEKRAQRTVFCCLFLPPEGKWSTKSCTDTPIGSYITLYSSSTFYLNDFNRANIFMHKKSQVIKVILAMVTYVH